MEYVIYPLLVLCFFAAAFFGPASFVLVVRLVKRVRRGPRHGTSFATAIAVPTVSYMAWVIAGTIGTSGWARGRYDRDYSNWSAYAIMFLPAALLLLTLGLLTASRLPHREQARLLMPACIGVTCYAAIAYFFMWHQSSGKGAIEYLGWFGIWTPLAIGLIVSDRKLRSAEAIAESD